MNPKVNIRNVAFTFIFISSLALVLFVLNADAECASPACCGVCENYINDSANISVNFPVLIVNKSVNPATFEQGELVEFKIEVLNIGNVSAYELSMKDILNEDLDYVQSKYDNSSSNYLIYKFVFNVTGNGEYSCQKSDGGWFSDSSQCVPKENIDFHYLSDTNELTWGKYGSSGGKELPPKVAYVIKFYARAKENASAGNLTNNVTIKANYDQHQYVCTAPASCQGGSCKGADGGSCPNNGLCYCDNCVSQPSGDCSDTSIKLSDHSDINLPPSITPNLNSSANFTILPKSEIYITKGINSTANKFTVGEIIPFVLNINSNLNETNATLTDVKVTDNLPYGIEFLNATLCNETNNALNSTTQPQLNQNSSDDPQASTILTFNIGNLTKDVSNIKICIYTKVASDASNAYGALKNDARVYASNNQTYETKNLSDAAEKYFYILKPASLKISKKTLTTNVVPNSIATYEITVWNEGDSEAVNITIFDPLPCNFTYINNSCNVTENNTDTNLTCPDENTTEPSFNISKIEGHSRIVFTFNVSVPNNVSGMCGNTIVAEAKDTSGNNLTVNYISQTSYIYTEHGFGYLQVNKEVINNKLFAVGEIVQYKIKVRNSGSVQSVNNVQLKDFLPMGMKFANISIQNCNVSNITGNYSTNGEILICNIGSVVPNETKIYYLNATVMDYKPVMVNKVEVNGSTSNGEQWFKDNIAVYVGKAKLKIEKKANKNNVKPGESIFYTLNISNEGDAPAYNISIKDVLPKGWKPTEGGEWLSSYTCELTYTSFRTSFSQTTLYFTGNELAPGASCEIKYRVQAPSNASGGLYQNDAEVSGNDSFGNKLDGDKTYKNVFVYEFRDMRLIKVANKTNIRVGEDVFFTIIVTNTGNVPYSVSLTDELPYGFENNTPISYDFALDRGASKTIHVGATVTNNAIPGLNANCVKASAYMGNKLVLERKDCAFVYVSSPSIDIEKWTITPTLNPGENATFFVRVKNKGTENISNLNLTDSIPGIGMNNADVSISKVSCSANITTGNYPNIAGGRLNRGEECVIRYTFKLPDNASGLYQNIVYATASTGTGTINESDKAYINVLYNPKYEVWKIADVSKVDIGESVNFTIFVSNEGNVPLNLSISDVLPNNFINLTSLTFIYTLNPGKDKNYTVIAKPNSGAVDSENCVVVNATAPKNEVLHKTACTGIHIKKPLLIIQKWTTTPSRLPNEKAEFYVMIKNDGEGIAKNVKVTDESDMTNSSAVISYEGDCDSLTIGTYPSLISNGTLHSNQYCIIHYNMTVPNVDGYTNIATLNATDAGNKQLNIQKSEAYVLASGITPSFSVEKFVSDGNPFAERGTYKNFTVKVKNLGNVYINITDIDETPPYGFNCAAGNIAGTTLQPGETTTTNITCFVNKSALVGVNVNEVRVWAIGNGGVNISQSDNEFVIVQEPKLKIEKKTNKKNAKPGDPITYTLNISNVGDAPAYNISIKDVLPKGWKPTGGEWLSYTCELTYTSSRTSFSQTTLYFTGNELAPGASCKIVYRIPVPPTTSTGIYTNYATVSGADKSTKIFGYNDEITAYIKGSPVLYVSMSANATYVKKGDTVKFTTRIENLGDVQMKDIVVEIILPPGFENLTQTKISGLSLDAGASTEVNVIAKVLNDTNATIGGAHVARVYVNATSFGGTKLKAESYATVYITSTPLSLIGDIDEKTLFMGSHLKNRFIVVNPSMFDTRDINLTVKLPKGLKYDVNSTMFNGVPLSDDESNGIVTEEDGKQTIEWKNLSMYSKSVGILSFSALVEDDVSGKVINASIIYNQHGEISIVDTSITINQEFVSKPFFYVFQDKEKVNVNEIIKYTVIVNDEFGRLNDPFLKLTANGLKILDVELKNNEENRTYNAVINGKIINLTNLTHSIEIDIHSLPFPTTSPKLNLDAVLTYNDGSKIINLQINKITDLLIPPEGIITNVESQNLNLSINLKDVNLNYTLHLKNGWNLIGIPIMPEKTNLEEILKPIEGKYTDVFTYNDRWNYKSQYMNKWFGDLSEILPGKGYWIKVDEDCNLTITGSEIENFSLTLNNGWNLISLPSLDEINLDDMDGYTDVFTYDDRWIYKSSYMNKWFGNLNTLNSGKGYWVKVEEHKIFSK